LGQYIAQIYEEVKGRPNFIVRETIGFEAVIADYREDVIGLQVSKAKKSIPVVEVHSPSLYQPQRNVSSHKK
jgi:hypothetical protein